MKFNENFFVNNKKTIELFKENNIIRKENVCIKLESRKIIVNATTYIDGCAYRCTSMTCGSKASLKKGSKMAPLNIKIVKNLRGMSLSTRL